MKSLTFFTGLSLALLVAGCDIHVNEPFDSVPPAPPQGVDALAGDNIVTVSWLPNREHDLAGYKVYVGGSYSGRYDLIGTTHFTQFVDRGARNGDTYYYTVTAYDLDGYESELSADVVAATPRPEGFDVLLYDYRRDSTRAGYDFSTNSVGLYSDNYTDLFYENYQGILYLDVWNDTDIQDMGYARSLDEILRAPTTGWSPTKDAQAIGGHMYVIRTHDNHYAKLRIVVLTAAWVKFDWAYQLVPNDPDLKSQPRAPLTRVWTRELY